MASPRVLLKVILVGDAAVGKTSLLELMNNRTFRSQYKATIGADISVRQLEVDGRIATVQFWDTAGQERFQSLGSAFYRGVDVCILVCDVSRPESCLPDLDTWYSRFSESATHMDSLPVVVLGNKLDLVCDLTDPPKQVDKALEIMEKALKSHLLPDLTRLIASYAQKDPRSAAYGPVMKWCESHSTPSRPIPYLEVSAKHSWRIGEAVTTITRSGLGHAPDPTLLGPLNSSAAPRGCRC